MLAKIEQAALENTASSEWEQLLDFTEQVAAKVFFSLSFYLLLLSAFRSLSQFP